MDRKPLNSKEIEELSINACSFFARNFGGAPSSFTNEQVIRSREFQAEFVKIVREIEKIHGI